MELLRWIHLSDIHYLITPSGERIREKVKKAIQEFIEKSAKVDCIIISGDFFQQGVIPEDTTNSFEEIIKELCGICLKGGLNDQWKQKVLFCPGNHDLNRDAYCLPGTEHHNTLHRKEILQKIRKNGSGEIEASEDELRLLTENSFELFDKEITELFREKDKPFNEYKIFDIPDIQGTQVCFVGLNTALTAGQIEDKEELRKKLFEARKEFEEADSNLLTKDGYKNAKKKYESYIKRYKQLFENQADDDGHLRFISKNSVNTITKTINDKKGNSSAVVVFGHHPISAFSEMGRELFSNAMDSWKTNLYLCGHEHRPSVLKEKVPFNGTEKEKINEIKVGGDFSDPSTWDIPSFAICTLCQEEDKVSHDYIISLKGDMVFRVKYCGDEESAIIGGDPVFPEISAVESDDKKAWILSHFINEDHAENSWNRGWKAYHFEISDAGKREKTSSPTEANEPPTIDDRPVKHVTPDPTVSTPMEPKKGPVETMGGKEQVVPSTSPLSPNPNYKFDNKNDDF